MSAQAAALSVDELEKKEEEEFRTGPLSVLTTSVKTNSQVRDQPSPCGPCMKTLAARLLGVAGSVGRAVYITLVGA